jgi:hypothetical protein
MSNIEIISDYTVLHYDDFPILFIGKNNVGEIIVGSFICENEDDDNLLYFHSIISSENALAFFTKQISYLDTMRSANAIFIVTKDYNDRVLNNKEVTFNQIDNSLLPLSFAFCPEIDESLLLIFKEKNILKDIPFTKKYKTMNKKQKHEQVNNFAISKKIYSVRLMESKQFIPVSKFLHHV